jgi:hypothetical protein
MMSFIDPAILLSITMISFIFVCDLFEWNNIVIDSRIAGSMNDIFYCLFVVYYRDYMTVCPIIFTHHNT